MDIFRKQIDQRIGFLQSMRQLYIEARLIKQYGYKLTVNKSGKSLEKEYRVRVLQLYLEGLGFCRWRQGRAKL